MKRSKTFQERRFRTASSKGSSSTSSCAAGPYLVPVEEAKAGG